MCAVLCWRGGVGGCFVHHKGGVWARDGWLSNDFPQDPPVGLLLRPLPSAPHSTFRGLGTAGAGCQWGQVRWIIPDSAPSLSPLAEISWALLVVPSACAPGSPPPPPLPRANRAWTARTHPRNKTIGAYLR